MANRTTLILGEESLAAARQLAGRYGCSVSEAIRRSVVGQRDVELRLTPERRRKRIAALRRLYKLFEGNDPAAEIRRRKAEDKSF